MKLRAKEQKVLCVDLDGTLVEGDTTLRLALDGLRTRKAVELAIKFFGDRAKYKRWLTESVGFDPLALRYNKEFVEWLREERCQGRKIVLATGCDQPIAERISNVFGLFDEVIGSDGEINMIGRAKARELVRRYGFRGFDYCGNSAVDIEVWRRADQAIVVNASKGTQNAARKIAKVARVFGRMRAEPLQGG